MKGKTHTYLALGDSYTIGEGIVADKNFPTQTVKLLRKAGYNFQDPEIVAGTGWTTNELQTAISKRQLANSYDFVTLLIGVNNQYRGRSVVEYAQQFEQLINLSLQFSGNNADHVFVLSIPDWGSTPFASGRDRKKIQDEIDHYNNINQKIAAEYNVPYIEITSGTREAANDESLLTGDKLHPSAKEYARWAKQLAEKIQYVLQ